MPADARVLLTALRDAKPGEDIVSFLRDHGGHRLADLIDTIRKAEENRGLLLSDLG